MNLCLGFCHRMRHLLWRAPYSTFDFTMSVTLVFMGIYLWIVDDLFTRYAGVYLPMVRVMDQSYWCVTFFCCGLYGLLIVLWPKRPLFILRILARMAIAFCLISFALNNLSSHPPPISAILYSMLSLIAIWSIIRTRCDG